MSFEPCLETLPKQFSRHVEKIARFLGGVKSAESCHVSGCHGFFGPDLGGFKKALRGQSNPPKHPKKFSGNVSPSSRGHSIKGRKNNKLNFFVAENGLFAKRHPFLTPQIPPKKFMWVPFLCLSQEMRHINFFFWGPKWGVLGGRQKV